jgi:hypothetical protein
MRRMQKLKTLKEGDCEPLSPRASEEDQSSEEEEKKK